MRIASLPILCGLLAIMVGCGPDLSHLPATVPARGVVTLDGTPVENATITFIADSGTYHATAVSDSSGGFTLKAFPEKDGAVPGSYKVEVNKAVVEGGGDAGTDGEIKGLTVKFGVPQKYATIGTSGLTTTIPEGGKTDIKIELKSK